MKSLLFILIKSMTLLAITSCDNTELLNTISELLQNPPIEGEFEREWLQVNENGFGDIANVHSSLIPFNNKLYAFYTNKYRFSQNGIDWSEEYTLPFSTTASVLAVHANYMYITTVNASREKQIWRSNNGINWEMVFEDTFGNTSGGYIRCGGEYDGYLYIGTSDEHGSSGTQIWRSLSGNNGTWQQVITDGFGLSSNIATESFISFNNALYVSVYNQSTGCRVFKSSNGVSPFSQVSSNGFGNPSYNDGLPSAAVFNNELFVGTYTYQDGCQIWKNPGNDNWTQANVDAFGELYNNVNNMTGAQCLCKFNDKLYVAALGSTSSMGNSFIYVFKYLSDTNWELINEPGFGFDNNGHPGTMIVFDNYLYISTRYSNVGSQVWRY